MMSLLQTMILKVNLIYENIIFGKLQEKIFNAIQNLPDGDVKRLTGNDIFNNPLHSEYLRVV